MGSFAHDVAEGLLQHLGLLGIWSYDDYVGEYDVDTLWPAVLGPVMPPGPDQIVVVSPGVQTRIRADVMQGIQIRLRGARSTTATEADPRVVADKMQEIQDALYPNGFPLSFVRMGQINVGAVLGPTLLDVDPDSAGRHGKILNVVIRTRKPRADTPSTSGGYGTGGYGL